MTRPVRLQLSREKGFNLQAHSRATNGLPAVNVARPRKWGNPYKVGVAFEGAGWRIPVVTPEIAVELFRERWQGWLDADYPGQAASRAALDSLRGHNLACWCPLNAPCHADVLLDLASGGLPMEPGPPDRCHPGPGSSAG